MSAEFLTASEGLVRTSGLVPLSSNYSAFWRATVGTPAPDFQTLAVWLDDFVTYTDYIWIGVGPTNRLILDIKGTVDNSYTIAAGDHDFQYVRTGTLHEVYVDGILRATVTRDVSAFVHGELYCGTDTYLVDWEASAAEQWGEWDRALTEAERHLVRLSGPSAVPTDLWTDTPLASDLLDDSGNGHDWAESGGTISFGAALGPTNLTPETAIDIGALPFSVTVDPQSNSDELWYRYSQATDQVLGFLCCNGTPRFADLSVYTGNNPAALTLETQEFDKRAIEWPVVTGVDVYAAILASNYLAGDTLTLSILPGPTSTVQAGDLVILTDDIFTNLYDSSFRGFFPATFFVPATGDVRQSTSRFPAAELSAALFDGRFVIAAKNVGTQSRLLIFYTAAPGMTEVTRTATADTIRSIGSDLATLYYVVTSPVFATPGTLRAVDVGGGLTGATWTLAVGNVGTVGAGGGGASLGIKRDNAVAYYPYSVIGGQIYRKDLVNNIDLPPFVSPNTALIPGDVIVLRDNTILAVFYRSSAPIGNLVVQYDGDGNLLRTLDYGSALQIHHITHDATDDPDYFWLWTERTAAQVADGSLRGLSRLRRVKISDGTTTADWESYLFSDLGGLADGIGPFDPTLACGPQRFGAPASCPLMVMMASAGPPPPTPGTGCPIDVDPGPGGSGACRVSMGVT